MALLEKEAIRFAEAGPPSRPVDEEFKNKRLNVSSAHGPVNIYFDEVGELTSIEWA